MCDTQEEDILRYHVVLEEKLLKNDLHNGMHRDTMLGFSYLLGFFLRDDQVRLCNKTHEQVSLLLSTLIFSVPPVLLSLINREGLLLLNQRAVDKGHAQSPPRLSCDQPQLLSDALPTAESKQ